MFPIRKLFSHGRLVQSGIRTVSGKGGPLTDVTVDSDGVAILTMQRAPVNSLNLELLQALNKSLDEVAQSKCKGMILTSASPKVFSAGLDISELYKPDIKKIEELWRTLQDVWIKIYGSNFPTAAAINGHSPAGGCVLALACEYRAMVTGRYTIGLNESVLGVAVSKWIVDTMANTISQREAELAITTGKLFTVEEALKVGLIDEIASDKSDSIIKCKEFLSKFDKIPPLARGLTKQKIRQGPLAWMQKNRQVDVEEFVTLLQNPSVQQELEKYFKALKAK